MYIGQKLKTLYLWNSATYKICSYIVGKHLPSSKRLFVIGMDMSVPDREITLLNSNKIPKNRKDLNSSCGVKIFQFLTYFVHKCHETEQFCKVSSKDMHFSGLYSHSRFCVFIGIWPEIRFFFSDYVTMKIKKKILDIKPPWKFLTTCLTKSYSKSENYI